MRGVRWWSRTLAGVLAVWFGLVMAAPAVLHSCPAGMAGHANADVHGAHHAQMPGPLPPDMPMPCQCLGHCALTTPALLPAAVVLPAATVTLLIPSAMSRGTETAFRPLPEHFLPIATAPPRLLG